jgi:hypothetical protein
MHRHVAAETSSRTPDEVHLQIPIRFTPGTVPGTVPNVIREVSIPACFSKATRLTYLATSSYVAHVFVSTYRLAHYVPKVQEE